MTDRQKNLDGRHGGPHHQLAVTCQMNLAAGQVQLSLYVDAELRPRGLVDWHDGLDQVRSLPSGGPL